MATKTDKDIGPAPLDSPNDIDTASLAKGEAAYIPVEEKGGKGAVAYLKGNAARHLTLFDKKAALINAELDKFGMGRYQICIWFLTGFGFLLDLSWAKAIGILNESIIQEMGVPSNKTGTLGAFSNAGLAVGALSAGLLVDIIGRKWTFNLTCLITSVFGMLVAAPRYNYYAVGGIYFLACLGLGGNIPIDALIALEFLPQNRRNLVALLSLWQPVGVVVACVIAYAFADPRYRCSPQLKSCVSPLLAEGEECCTVASNMGWRYTLISIGCITLAVFFLRFFVFTFHESPKFLLAKGREQEAIDVLHAIAKFNRAPPPTLTVEHFAEVERIHHGATTDSSSAELGAAPTSSGPVSMAQSAKQALRGFFRTFSHLKLIAATKLQLGIFILLALAYMGDYWSFNLAGNFLPIILAQYNTSKGAARGQETYKQYIWINLPGVLGAVMALFSVQLPILGRKWSLVISAVLQGLAMAMYTQVRGPAGYVGLNALEYIMQTFFNAVLYASAPELFDTAVRGSASGMLSCIGRLAGIVAPIAGQKYIDPKSGSSTVLWLGAGGIWLSAIVLCFLPVEMRKRQMY